MLRPPPSNLSRSLTAFCQPVQNAHSKHIWTLPRWSQLEYFSELSWIQFSHLKQHTMKFYFWRSSCWNSSTSPISPTPLLISVVRWRWASQCGASTGQVGFKFGHAFTMCHYHIHVYIHVYIYIQHVYIYICQIYHIYIYISYLSYIYIYIIFMINMMYISYLSYTYMYVYVCIYTYVMYV